MAETSIPEKKRVPSLNIKPIFILTVAAIVLAKIQRTAAVEETTENPVCPGYCSLPPERATRGKAPFRMWYFDPSEGSCRRFRWGGRGGNKNRFHKKADCEETCSKCSPIEMEEAIGGRDPNPETKDTVCSTNIDEGRCPNNEASQAAPQLFWHFNKDKAKCSPFIFYGCGGNENRFPSQKDCEETCH